MKFSWAISWVKWLNSEKTNVSKTISVLAFRVLNHIPEMLFFSPFKHLTQLIVQENFIILSHRKQQISQLKKCY